LLPEAGISMLLGAHLVRANRMAGMA